MAGDLWAVGTNSRCVYICQSPASVAEAEAGPQEATIVTTFAKHHKGSVYCLRCGDNQHQH